MQTYLILIEISKLHFFRAKCTFLVVICTFLKIFDGSPVRTNFAISSDSFHRRLFLLNSARTFREPFLTKGLKFEISCDRVRKIQQQHISFCYLATKCTTKEPAEDLE